MPKVKSSGLAAPSERARKPAMVADSWPSEWRSVAEKLITLNLAASALKDQIGATALEMKSTGLTQAQIHRSFSMAAKANVGNLAANGTNETVSVTSKSLSVSMQACWPERLYIYIEVSRA